MISIIFLGSILLLAAITDLLKHKVYNWLTLPTMGLGLGLNLAQQGFPGLWSALIGLLVGGLIFYPFFFWGGMGAGDIKLMAVVGAFMGWVFVINAAVYIGLTGGILAIIILLIKGELWLTLKNIFRFFRSLVLPNFKVEPLQLRHSMPYAVVIAIGSIATYFLPPFISLKI